MNFKPFTGFFKETLFVQVLLVAIFVVIVIFSSWSFKGLPKASKDNNLATLVISLKSGERMFQGEVVEGMTILDALIVSSSTGNIRLNYETDNNGAIDVTEINGHNKDSINFVYYLNDSMIGAEDINKINLKAGDYIKIEFK